MENKKLVAKSNALVDAYYSLTIREHQFIAFAAALIPRTDIKLDHLDITIEFHEFTEFFKLDKKQIRPNQLFASADKLYERDITFIDDDIEKRRRWLLGIDKHQEGKVVLKFSTEILPYLTGLSKNYTLYTIGITRDFKCQHSFPIYELLAKDRNKNSEVFTISIEQLRKKLCLEDKYQKFHDFKRYVINPVFKDLDNCTDLCVDWELIKQGRTVTHLQIIFKESKAASPPKKKAKARPKPKKITDTDLAKHARPGESREAAFERIQKMLAGESLTS